MVRYARRHRSVLSLDAPLTYDTDREFIDMLRDDEKLEEVLINRDLVAKGMHALSTRERFVVERTMEGRELLDIAEELEKVEGKRVTSNRIRQLQIRARTKIVSALFVDRSGLERRK